MTDDPLKHTPACELDRDNRVNSDPMALIFQYQSEARELRAEVERLQEDTWALEQKLRADNERLTRRIAQLGTLVEALADDLECELNGHYPPEVRAYPSEQRRYERDMANVYEARRALEPKA